MMHAVFFDVKSTSVQSKLGAIVYSKVKDWNGDNTEQGVPLAIEGKYLL